MKGILDWIEKRRMKKQGIAKNYQKTKAKMPPNIYESTGNKKATTFRAHLKQFNFIHYAFKEGLLVPAIMKIDKWFGKRMMKKMPDVYYNKNFKIFDQAYEQTIKDWTYRFCAGNNPDKIKACKGRKGSIKVGRSQVCLRTMKNLVLTIAFYDTAYREFLNMLFHNQALGMLKEYGGKSPKHILYVEKSVYDPKYFVAWKMNELMEAKTPEEIKKAAADLPPNMHVAEMNKDGKGVKKVISGKGSKKDVKAVKNLINANIKKQGGKKDANKNNNRK